jgi:hypothetical protein
LQIGRDLAQKNPEAYLPYVAQTLTNLGVLNQNRPEQARKEYTEALQIYEEFAKRDPKRFSVFVQRVKKLLEHLQR